jgi:hypothetical protein
MALWKQHHFTLQALLAKLQQAASVRLPAVQQRSSTYA